MLQVLTSVTGQEKEIKGMYIKMKEIKLSFFAVDTIVFIENPEESTEPTRMNKLINFRRQNEHTKINCTSLY